VLKTLERASDLKMLISFPFFCLATSCVDLNSLRNIRYPAEWTGVNVPVVFRMKIKISKSRLSLLISGIICLNGRWDSDRILEYMCHNLWQSSETQYTFCDPLTLPVTRIGDAIHMLMVLIGDRIRRGSSSFENGVPGSCLPIFTQCIHKFY
jgi:hypothetical protein